MTTRSNPPKAPRPPAKSNAPPPRKPNPLLDPGARWQRFNRFVWDRKRG